MSDKILQRPFASNSTYLTLEHMSNVILSLDQLLAILLHLCIIRRIGVNLFTDLLMLVEKPLCLRQVSWDVF